MLCDQLFFDFVAEIRDLSVFKFSIERAQFLDNNGFNGSHTNLVFVIS